jgi:hypothetical protein
MTVFLFGCVVSFGIQKTAILFLYEALAQRFAGRKTRFSPPIQQ